MDNPPRCLDINELQVAISFDADPNFTWHARILLVRLGDGGRWVCSTPTFVVEIVDLATHRVVPMPRGGRTPVRVMGDLLDNQLAQVLGALPVAAAAVDSTWVIADVAHPSFGEVAPDDVLQDPNGSVFRQATGLVCFFLRLTSSQVGRLSNGFGLEIGWYGMGRRKTQWRSRSTDSWSLRGWVRRAILAVARGGQQAQGPSSSTEGLALSRPR